MDSYIRYNHFFLRNNVLKEYDNIKEETKSLKSLLVNKGFHVFLKQRYFIV